MGHYDNDNNIQYITTTIGYGDISAGTSDERLVACFAMCTGCALFAWITSQITHRLPSITLARARARSLSLSLSLPLSRSLAARK